MRVCSSVLKYLSLAVVIVWAMAFFAFAAVDPVTVEVHYQNGVKYFKRGVYDKSIQEFEKTLSLDPANGEAKAYLDKAREFQKQAKPVEPQVGHDTEVQQLYDQGRDLYKKGDYEGAKDAFGKILAIKPVDDSASYYREQCEIYIARKIAREKKAAEKAKAKENASQAKQKKTEEAAQKRADRQEMLAKRAVIKEESKIAREKAAPAEAPAAPQPVLTKAEIKKQEKQKLAEEKRQAAAEKRDAQTQEREAKIQAKAERQARSRQEKAASRESKIVEKNQAVAKKNQKKQTELEAREERQRNKEIFIKGVEQYSHKDYEGAIATFNDLMAKESQSGMVYTRTAQRLKDKAELRLKGVGEDKEI